MDEYRFEDLLAGGTVTCSYPGLETVRVGGVSDAESCESLFFPGCSFINYALPLVQSVYDLLVNAGQCDGISLLCCGKILEYEGDGGAARAAFEQQFRDHIAGTSIKRIVAACPNCVSALRRLLAKDERTSSIEVVALPRVLVDMGYRVDQETAASVVYNDGRIEAGTPVTFCPKDSCPDRATGEFADAKVTAELQEKTITNTYNETTQEGVLHNSIPYIVLALVAIGGMVAYVVVRRRNADEA